MRAASSSTSSSGREAAARERVMRWPSLRPRSAPRDPAAPTLSRGWLRKLDRLHIALARPTSMRPGANPVRRDSASGLEVHGYRPYAWGDDLRHLDWNAYARLGEPLIRRYRAELESCTYVLLDASRSMAESGDKFSFAKQLALGLAYLCLRRHEPVRIAAFSDTLPGGLVVSPVWQQRPHLLAAFRFVEALTAGGTDAWPEMTKRLLQLAARPGLVFLISDFFLPAEALAEPMDRLRAQRLLPVALQLLSAADWQPFAGARRVRIRDAESGREREVWWSPQSAERYRQALGRQVQSVRAVCAAHGVLHQEISTAEGLEHCFLRTLVQARILC